MVVVTVVGTQKMHHESGRWFCSLPQKPAERSTMEARVLMVRDMPPCALLQGLSQLQKVSTEI